MNVPFESQFDPQESSVIARTALGSVDTGARASVVNRTHRVVRQRAKVMQARRSHVRGLMVPLILCSILLILTAVAVWSGLYQGVEVVEADVAALATSDANNHFLVMLLWFVPVSIVLLGTFLIRRSRSASGHETVR
jgi:hypothetical protein